MHGSRIFCQGGSGPDSLKTAGTTFFFLVFFYLFLVLKLFYSLQEGVQWFYYRENNTFSRIQRGSNIFQGGPASSRGGPNTYFPPPPPPPPMDPHINTEVVDISCKFDWDPDHLSNEPPLEGGPTFSKGVQPSSRGGPNTYFPPPPPPPPPYGSAHKHRGSGHKLQV